MSSVPASVSIGTLIAWIESRNNPYAMRFEPTVHSNIHAKLFTDPIVSNIRAIHACTYETAAIIYSTSFGAYQEMGENLYDKGCINYPYTVAEFLANKTIAGNSKRFPIVTSGFSSSDMLSQDYAFAVHCVKRGISYSTQDMFIPSKRDNFALHYNGSVAYSQNIVEALAHFNVKDITSMPL
jgi:hypothetical protein